MSARDTEQHESDQHRYTSDCDLCDMDGHLHYIDCPNNPLGEWQQQRSPSATSMNALLTADEAARLRVGVNVIVRQGDAYDDWNDRKFVAPQDWEALTGPCPTCHADSEWHDHPPHYSVERDECFCSDCKRGRRIVPLYTECDRCVGNGLPPGAPLPVGGEEWCWVCEDSPGLMLVGRGSIEVVPFTDVWPKGANHTQPVTCVTRNGVLYVEGLDPLPIPGRDFGIVIDVTELAA